MDPDKLSGSLSVIMDSLLRRFQSNVVKAIGYAEAVLLCIAGVDPPAMAGLLQKALDTTLRWGEKHGLSFNPTKTMADSLPTREGR